MTNGENLKNIYPDLEIIGEIKDVYVIMLETHNVLSPKLEVFKSWWNAEYKEPSSSENLNKSENPTGSTTKNDLAHNLCDSCTNIGCEFQSGIVRTKCAFYMPTQLEPDNCGNYIVHLVPRNVVERIIKSPRTKEQMLSVLNSLPPQESIAKNDLLVREFEEIVVEYPPEDLCTYPEYKGKPYFSIKYKEGNDYFIGYGTYNPEVLSRYLKDYFMPITKNDLVVDAVSRKAVHDMLENLPIAVEDKWFNWLQKACMRLADLPPVTQQEPRKGEWLRMSDLPEQEDDRYRCSYCGNVIHHKSKMDLYTFNSWCGRCGSDNGKDINYEVEK